MPAHPSRSGDPGARQLRALAGILNQRQPRDSGSDQMAVVQAEQALQIGKLSRAVEDLARKDWNMRVNLRSSSSGRLLDSINRRL
jgi:hypothetical protein